METTRAMMQPGATGAPVIRVEIAHERTGSPCHAHRNRYHHAVRGPGYPPPPTISSPATREIPEREDSGRYRAQMSKPSQQKPNTDQNGVSVIQTQAHGSGLQQVPQLVPVSPGGGGKAIPPSKMKKTITDKESEEYRQRRERNNLAVKKSRMRSKQKAQDTQQRVNELKEENERLEAKIKLLSKELSVLKDLFLEHAHNLADNVQPQGAEAPSNNNNNSGNNNNNNNNNNNKNSHQ
ncbi:CCAAT/enhancer-binding protein gamma-like [Scleropages formosus]|uniref:CCAAT/enhancer-binding protein gamma n=2 Tax=Scleropages formosus TaxID=113540 RepID=A0A0P7UQA4_SCLFO|nr:CCAAT/enhancer-binding protein gamma-like [Scleropages formosus]